MRMLSAIALATAFSVSAAGATFAQTGGQPYKSPEDCVADYGKLDVNKDGMIDKDEMSKYSQIRTNVDVNNDGMISSEETAAACKSGVAKAFRRSH